MPEPIPNQTTPHDAGEQAGGSIPAAPFRRSPLHLAIAYFFTGLGIVGAFLPLLPTTPFLLIAVWAAPKGSPALHRWLYEHPAFGSALVAWEQKRAVSTRAKLTACVLLVMSWLIMFVQTSTWVVPAITAVLFVGIAAFLVTRPTP